MYIKNFIYFFLKFILIFFISLFLILITDFFFGRILINKYIDQIKNNPYYLKKQRITHRFYHHTLAANINYNKAGWGNIVYRLCTDENGFKKNCNISTKTNNYDVAFIGDSFVEGVGFEYQETFTGIFHDVKKINLVNMGVSSYSTKIYLSKIYYFIQKGLFFKHIVVFIDPADLIDDSKYILKSNLKVEDKSFLKKIEKNLKNFFPLIDYSILVFKNRHLTQQINNQENNQVNSAILKGRSSWTYSKSNEIKEFKLKVSDELKEQIDTMTKLHELLKEKKIKLSIVIYPWPETLMHDSNESIYIKTWENFCENKCTNFVNFIPIFIEANTNKELTISKYYLNGDIHFNKEGHKLIGNYLIKNLKL